MHNSFFAEARVVSQSIQVETFRETIIPQRFEEHHHGT